MALPLIGAGTLAGFMIVPLVVKVLAALGIGFVTYTGFNALLDYTLAEIQGVIQQLPVEQLSLLGVMNIDQYITILFSAYTTKMLINGLTGAGTLTKFNLKGIGT